MFSHPVIRTFSYLLLDLHTRFGGEQADIDLNSVNDTEAAMRKPLLDEVDFGLAAELHALQRDRLPVEKRVVLDVQINMINSFFDKLHPEDKQKLLTFVTVDNEDPRTRTFAQVTARKFATHFKYIRTERLAEEPKFAAAAADAWEDERR